ncbi:hypothetical protein FAIPA1_370007 [Frankia sp. AiPs1]
MVPAGYGEEEAACQGHLLGRACRGTVVDDRVDVMMSGYLRSVRSSGQVDEPGARHELRRLGRTEPVGGRPRPRAATAGLPPGVMLGSVAASSVQAMRATRSGRPDRVVSRR